MVAGAVVSVVALGAVAWWASRQDAPSFPTDQGELAALAAAVVVYVFTTALRAERWERLLVRDGAAVRRADCYALTAVGFMGNNVLPARGGDLMRVFLLVPRVRIGARRVIGTLVAERVLDVGVLIGLFVVLAYGVLDGVGVPGTGRMLAAAGLAVGAAVLVRWLWTRGEREGRLARLAEYARPMLVATTRLRGRHGTVVLALTIMIWLTETGTWYLCAMAAGLELSPLEALYLISLASIFVLVPAGPGYAGTLDAAVVFGAHAIGAGSAQAVGFLLTLRFVLLVPITIVGLVLLVVRYGGWAQVRAARSRRSAPAGSGSTEP